MRLAVLKQSTRARQLVLARPMSSSECWLFLPQVPCLTALFAAAAKVRVDPWSSHSLLVSVCLSRA